MDLILLGAFEFRRVRWEGGCVASSGVWSPSCLDSACYRRYCLQKLVWSLESLCRIFLKEFLKKNYSRLWNVFESLER